MSETIKVRAKAFNGIVYVKALISHPMESGLRKNKKTGKKIPANHIQEVIARANGRLVMDAVWGGAFSRNPYLSFKYQGETGDIVKLMWVDNRGRNDSITYRVR